MAHILSSLGDVRGPDSAMFSNYSQEVHSIMVSVFEIFVFLSS